jgi:hypothetical protein
MGRLKTAKMMRIYNMIFAASQFLDKPVCGEGSLAANKIGILCNRFGQQMSLVSTISSTRSANSKSFE